MKIIAKYVLWVWTWGRFDQKSPGMGGVLAVAADGCAGVAKRGHRKGKCVTVPRCMVDAWIVCGGLVSLDARQFAVRSTGASSDVTGFYL